MSDLSLPALSSVIVTPPPLVTTVEAPQPLVHILNIGVPGPAGSGDKHLTWAPPGAAAVWTIPHGLGKYPAVAVVDTTDHLIVGELEYLDLNTVRVTFSVAVNGRAFLN